MEYNGDCKDININNPIMMKNELSMLKKVKEIMESYLKNYKSTLEDEEKLLKEKRNSMNFNEFNCCIMRIGELRIFRYFIDLSEKCSELFSKGKGEIEKALNGRNQKYRDYEGYIKEIKGKLFID